ncbi:fluoride efflux transporter FluC [Kitasatospora cineracea]|uniref:fluoride efflux transporter FluC n=1 Tax=Kitasatospora cineracea TaxID=88074 RepID=UPI003789F8E8
MRPITTATARPEHHDRLFRILFPHPSPNPARRWRLTAQVALGGAAGAAARAAVDLAWRAGAGFPWPTFAINAVGCAAMGVLMTVLHARPGAPMWAGPVLGSGVLGGFTTFSAFANDIRRLLADGQAAVGLGYAAASLVVCVGAAALAGALTARAVTAPAVRA